MSEDFDRPDIRPDADMRDTGWQEIDEDGRRVGGDAVGRGAATSGDEVGDEARAEGGQGSQGGQASQGGRDPWLEALQRANLDDVDPDGGTPIAGPADRSDIANLRGGQHDAATGGSDIGPTTGGGDTGAV